MSPKSPFPKLHDAGDAGLLVEFGATYDPAINARVTAFDALISCKNIMGLIESVPSFRSVLLRIDPLVCDYAALKTTVRAMLDRADEPRAKDQTGTHFRLPVVYGGEFGPDLAEVAALTGLAPKDIPEAHSAQPLHVAMLGFAPGLAYLGQLPPVWGIPRAEKITPEVPVGAILVAVRQTVLPATPIPTGWRQIGRTPFQSFRPNAERPFLLSPGDTVSFFPITEAEFDRTWTFEATP